MLNDRQTLDPHQRPFDARMSRDGEGVRLWLGGNADLRAREALTSLLERLHDEALKSPVQTVVVDLRELEFMNSSCIKSFITWLAKVQDLEAGRQYKIRFVSRPEVLWQRRSLHALRCFALDLVTVEG